MMKIQKDKRTMAMVNQIMPSEESNVEDDEEIISVHLLPYSTMFRKIDNYNIQKLKSPQARR